MDDTTFMRRALALAEGGRGWVAPNPMVGAVVVRDGQVVGEGFHPRVGAAHAEVFALEAAGEAARGSTLYVTLEPCCHEGKRTPPCLPRVLASGVARVVVAVRDPNPAVAGRAIAALRTAGLEVLEGVLADEAFALIEPFNKHVTTGLPLVVLKAAMTADGKIATATGSSRWVSGEASRARVQDLRATYGAVLVGIGTVRADDPRLTCRLDGARQPLRVVVDPRAQTPVGARLLAVDPATGRVPALVAVAAGASEARVAALREAGAEVVAFPDPSAPERVDLRALVGELGRRGVTGVLLEGGAGLNAAALAAGVVDKVVLFLAPKLVGGAAAPTPVGGPGIADMAEALPLHGMRAEACGEDLVITAYLADPVAAPAGERAVAGGA